MSGLHKSVFQVKHPRNGATYLQRQYSSVTQVDGIFAAAQQAQQVWRQYSLALRHTICARAIAGKLVTCE